MPDLQKTSSVTRSADTFALASHCLSAWPANWQNLITTSPNAEMICLAPSHAPPKFTLLYFSVRVDNNATTAMIDTGASHSFVTEELVHKLCLPVKTLSTPMTATDFGGTVATLTKTVTTTFCLASITRRWMFYVSEKAPAPVVIGLDLVLKWPLYLNPLDKCLYFPRVHASSSSRSLVSFSDELAPISIGTDIALPFRESNLPIKDNVSLEVSDVTILDLDQDVLMDHDVVSEGVVDDLSPDLSFYARDGFLTVIQRNSVTASGFAEAEALKEFISKLSPSFRELVNEFPFLFAPPDRDPPNRSVKHYIHVSPDCVPAARRAYPLSHMKLEAMRSQIRELVDKGWVVPSCSPWASPILLVPKDQGKKLRLCIDFHDLNTLTKKDRFPLPRIDLLLHRASKARVFSKIDLASGFHQIEVFPPHRELTAFILPETIDGQSLWE